MKKIEIIDSLNNMISGTKEIEIFDQERYKKDFENLLNDTFPEYEIVYSLDLEDKVNSLLYPYILGDIDDNERDRISELITEDPFLTYFADHDYFSPKIKTEETSINKQNLGFTSNSSQNNGSIFNHKDDSQCIVNGNYDLSHFQERNLTSIELSFLKYISGLKTHLKFISGDWTYNYHLDFQDVLNQFIGQKLVEVVELNLREKLDKIFTVKDLEKLLQDKNLKISGKKSDLIEKLIENFSGAELEGYAAKRYIKYQLTEYGRTIIEPIKPSLTRDMEFEDKCYGLVMSNSYENAYNAINDFREKYNINMGLSCGFSVPSCDGTDSGLSLSIRGFFGKIHKPKTDVNNPVLIKYRKLAEFDLGLPEILNEEQKSIISCIIVGDMLNSDNSKITDFVIRITDTNLTKKQVLEYVEKGRMLLKQST